MTIREINFDGLIGPSHNYAGLSLGNLASTRHAGDISRPREAALQGIEKMRANLELGLVQGVFMPLPRPNGGWLRALGADYLECNHALAANAMSASSMWAANAATVSPAPDTADGRCHLTVANLKTMPHRSHEWPDTLAQLRLAFAHEAFAVHSPVPPVFGDEGAANFMRLADRHADKGLEIFVYGVSGGPFPARQHIEASRAVARLHRLDPERVLFVQQSDEAISAGAFHNDVVAVANERTLFAHEKAFADRDDTISRIAERFPGLDYVEVADADVPLADAISSYLFNAQLLTLPSGEQTLVVPSECRETPTVWRWLEAHLASNGPIRRVEVVDVRQSMANGGGPACLRLRVACDPATVDPRFLVDQAKLDAMAKVVARTWPETIDAREVQSETLVATVTAARRAMLDLLDLGALDLSD
ncbi:N-succinylarginine dihydrolase [Sphingomicrobium astaxanthinifaciens]|uniref:N-succinylarginine dihydrolase n=1 Tax=Sphingomicrobium astaxanthinifaciens TaxID=1227949 RepID=UPI001FCB69D1|nr:N-succinylarginine dihydrolase [Sphingomicrobium astaxanthinifaciens]MCJ7420653.1 N-succinylarginine dihydrolase [Sphingomicrobium astaxanthinifaciens]